MINVDFSGYFHKMYEELISDELHLKKLIFHRIKLFRKNPQDTRLDNHPLTKRMEGKYAFSVDDDIRIVYEWLGKNTARFLAIGKHSQVYSQKFS